MAISTHISPSSLKIVVLTTSNPRLPDSSTDAEMDKQRQLGSDKPDSGAEDKTLSHVIASMHKLETGGRTLESELRELQKAWCVYRIIAYYRSSSHIPQEPARPAHSLTGAE